MFPEFQLYYYRPGNVALPEGTPRDEEQQYYQFYP